MHIAIRIARYAMTNSDKVKLVSLSNRTLMLIKDLMSNRDCINKSYQSIKVSIREMERVDKSTGKELVKLNKAALNGLYEFKVNASPGSPILNTIRARYQAIAVVNRGTPNIENFHEISLVNS